MVEVWDKDRDRDRDRDGVGDGDREGLGTGTRIGTWMGTEWQIPAHRQISGTKVRPNSGLFRNFTSGREALMWIGMWMATLST